jgi:hypothetical protein
LFPLKLSAQSSEIFAPIGAVWYYQNEGELTDSLKKTVDSAIKIIKIEYVGIGNPVIVSFDCTYSSKPTLKVSYLKVDSSVVRENFVGIDVSLGNVYYYNPITLCRTILYSFQNKKNYSFLIEPIYFKHAAGKGSYKWFASFKDSVTINGKKLMMIQQSPDSVSQYGQCIRFCSPIIERIGSLGYMFPVNICAKPYYAGRLISYFDSSFGYWKVPDSLKNLACSFQYLNSGIDQNDSRAKFSIFPNPAQSLVTISLNGDNDYLKSIEIFNLDGKLIYFQTVGNNERIIRFPVDLLPSEMYLLRLKFRNQTYYERFVKN